MSKAKIRELNDAMRHSIGDPVQRGDNMAHATPGVMQLEPDERQELYTAIKEFDDFSKDNDPHKEHDFGKVTLAQIDYFWKIDYYDKELAYASEDPADPEKTTRVLTIMRADEY